MDSRALLIFDLDGARFALDAAQVRESIWLPELASADEAPPWIVGIFSLRGRIVHVADLHLRLGHPARRYSTNDQVVVVEADNLPMGLIVSEIREVVELSSADIQPPPQFDTDTHLVTGEMRVGDTLVTLLDVSRLLPPTPAPHPSPPPRYAQGRALQPPPPHAGEGRGGGAEKMPGTGYFCPQATPQERALFHARAVALQEAAAEEASERLGLAVVELGGEYFGVKLAAVQEFCDIAQLSPIPCCPPHILGAMNLRGNLLTLVDPHAALNLAPGARGGKAVIARLGEQALGIAVDEVHGVVYLRGEELQAPPAALRERGGVEITAIAPYAGRTMTVLELPALLAREEWIVN